MPLRQNKIIESGSPNGIRNSTLTLPQNRCIWKPKWYKVQSLEIPVIQADHLIAKLRVTESLESAMKWLKARKYLPKEGKHFKVCRTTATIGNWSVKWYGLQPLIDDAFYPL